MKNEEFDEPVVATVSTDEKSEVDECKEYELDEYPWDITDNSTFAGILRKMNTLYRCKNNDYGNSFDQTMDKFGILSSVIRINDKVNRLNNLVDPTKQVQIKETIEDTLLDLANYCVMTLAYLKDEQKSV